MLRLICVKAFVICALITLSTGSVKKPHKRIKLLDKEDTSKERYILVDLPVERDLGMYLRSLNKVMTYCMQNKREIDLNFAFGLFLTNVHLKTAMKHRKDYLPVFVLKPVKDIIRKIDELLKQFRTMVKSDKNVKNIRSKLIYSLFTNETMWIDRMQKYDLVMNRELYKQKTVKELEKTYSSWNAYLRNLANADANGIPTPQQSDVCMASLAKNPVKDFTSLPPCSLAKSCLNILINGTDHGYALTHRLLLLLLARYSRGCSIFSPRLDRELVNRFCIAAYSESEYISHHGYQLMDLLMEQMSLCAVKGDIEFLRRTWIKKGLKLQSEERGCFRELGTKKIDAVLAFARDYGLKYLDQAPCSGHLTATAASVVALGTRYVLETADYRELAPYQLNTLIF